MIYVLFLILVFAILGLGILVGVYCFKVAEYHGEKFPPDPEIDALPMCTCTDFNLCDTWCRTKALFVKHPPQDHSL